MRLANARQTHYLWQELRWQVLRAAQFPDQEGNEVPNTLSQLRHWCSGRHRPCRNCGGNRFRQKLKRIEAKAKRDYELLLAEL